MNQFADLDERGERPDYTDYMASLPLVEALWWFTENIGPDHRDRTTYFFALRERYRREVQWHRHDVVATSEYRGFAIDEVPPGSDGMTFMSNVHGTKVNAMTLNNCKDAIDRVLSMERLLEKPNGT